ncbi:MAG: hypothetical protein U1E97_08675 [Alphaproteobacteria bacterium]
MFPNAGPDIHALRRIVVATGIAVAVLALVIGVWAQLQIYADGSIFAYSIAVQDAWAYHWHNISGRIFVYLFFFVPAEAVVALTGNASAGVATYGVLHFGAPGLGLLATFVADQSRTRMFFAFACLATAGLNPLVFGFPTEMWAAHALFWPALAICHRRGQGLRGFAMVVAALLSLMLTHEGALVLALVILGTVFMEGWRAAAPRRVGAAFLIALAGWGMVKAAIRPDDYFAAIIASAALDFIDPKGLGSRIFLVLGGAIAAYLAIVAAFRLTRAPRAELFAALIVAAELAIYWFGSDGAVHASERYPARTALLIMVPILAGLSAGLARVAEDGLRLPASFPPGILAWVASPALARLVIGAYSLILLVHAVETVKFVDAWVDYKGAVRALAMGDAADPELGDPHFVSSSRIQDDLNRLSWMSTTPYLSVLVAPGLAPRRLVVDPARDNYFWLSCETAKASEHTGRAVPLESRQLVRVYACLHR